MNNSPIRFRSMTFACLLALTGFFAACHSSKNQESQSEVQVLTQKATNLQIAIKQGNLLSASSTEDKSNLENLIQNIKLNVIRLSKNPSDFNTYQTLRILLKQLEQLQILGEDRAQLDHFFADVFSYVEAQARTNGYTFTDLGWTLFSYRFSNGVKPFGSFPANAWYTDWSLDQSYVVTRNQTRQVWLTTPVLNLRDIRNPAFRIEHLLMIDRRKDSPADFDRQKIKNSTFKAFVFVDYDGIPRKDKGTEVSLAPYPDSPAPSGNDFHKVTTDSIDLSAFSGSKVMIGFLFDYDKNIAADHYLTWQISHFELIGAGSPPAIPQTLLEYVPGRDTLLPLQSASTEPEGGRWELCGVVRKPDGKNIVECLSDEVHSINSNNIFVKVDPKEGRRSDAWLLSPTYRLKDREDLKLFISEGVRQPQWKSFKIKISGDFKGGDPREATWKELALHEGLEEIPGDGWTIMDPWVVDLSALNLEQMTLAFQFIDTQGDLPRGTGWELLSFRVEGIGQPIPFTIPPVQMENVGRASSPLADGEPRP